MSDIMTNQQFNSFYLVSTDVYTQFYELIKQDHPLYECLVKKAEQNPFYLDFLRDTWILFYHHPKNLITDPIRTLYLLIRKTILDIATHTTTINQYFKQTANNERLALYYALLLCESISIYFKKMLQNDSFQEHIQHIARYYYQNQDRFEPNIIMNGVDEPLYARSQAYVIKAMLRPSLNDSSIGQIFNQNLQKQLSILDILTLNHDSCLDHIKSDQITL